MREYKTVDSKVLEILKECPAARYDDMLLFYAYYNRFGIIKAGERPLAELVLDYKKYGLPCFETIRRARQRIQSLLTEYGRSMEPPLEGNVNILVHVNTTVEKEKDEDGE